MKQDFSVELTEPVDVDQLCDNIRKCSPELLLLFKSALKNYIKKIKLQEGPG